MPKNNEYDAIIIGAGIGGLVCGCYLAKAGMKVLIAEKNTNPGGCCVSFVRGGYSFDACVHFLGSLRQNGVVAKVLKDFDLLHDGLKIIRHDPSDTIINNQYSFSFWNDIKKTINELSEYFPKEKINIKKFFNYILAINGYDFLEVRSETFQNILDSFFENNDLKNLLGLPILGNTGVSPEYVSAIKAITLYKEFMLDGGYSVCGGIQMFPDELVKKFQHFGGEIILKTPINKILVKNNSAYGIATKKREQFFAKYVVSNADACHTFFDLIGVDNISSRFLNSIDKLDPSLSMFALYLGVDGSTLNIPSNTNVWHIRNCKINKLYKKIKKNKIKNIEWFLMYFNPETNTISSFFNVPYLDRKYWKREKDNITNLLINKLNEVEPNIKNSIRYQDAATPDTIFKWTRNYKGAAYGWAGTVNQFALSGFSEVTPVKNLFLTGHWTTLGQGISGVVYLGGTTAEIILRLAKKRKQKF